MIKSIQVTLFVILLTMLANAAIPQVKIMAKPGEIFDLRELGAIVLLKGEKAVVEYVMPAEGRHPDFREIDIQKNDEILFFNGKKIQSTTEMEKLYNSIAVNEEIQLGYKRNDKLGIIKFKKADPASFPKRKMMKITADSHDPSGKFQEVEIDGKKYKVKDGKVNIDGKEMKVEDLMEHTKEKSSADDKKIINNTK